MSNYEPDNIDGRLVPPLVVDADFTLSGTHTGTVHVEASVLLTLDGTLHGTLVVHPGAKVVVNGTQAGTVSVMRGAQVVIFGKLNGEVEVARGATVVVETGGRLAGGLTNQGRVVVRGVYGGRRRGSGVFALEDGGQIKRPEVIGGLVSYIWRDDADPG